MLLSSAVTAVVFALSIAWTCSTSSQASAQQPGQPGYGAPAAAAAAVPSIALVDVNYIFKKDLRLKAQLKELQNEGEAVQKGFENELRDLQEQSKQLGGPTGFKPGTPEYTQLEEKLVTLKSGIQGKVALKRKEFVQREAKLYYNAYREISDEVTNFCQQRGIAMVMNFNGDAIDPENPDTVARGIQNKCVYYNRSLDITPYILQRFEKPLSASQQNGPGGSYVPQPAQ